ncbi:DUF6634 family protein [Rhizobium sp. LjRoot258]|uniref:DUF6634 family protein n=1 Tax=Rhizobium sp. LjRoot258 TaxID=3342299 RepID=UPI003ECDAFC1
MAVNKVPTEAELAAAPLLQGWVLESPSNSRPWLYGWFFGHPEIDDGDHGHTSPVLQMDTGSPAHWATTENRLYRLGVSYPPAEREIRYWSQKLRRRRLMPLGEAPGGGDDVEEMIAFIREEKPFREQKLERMVNAYRDELAMLKK